MPAELSYLISEQVPETSSLYHRLILVVGPPRTGKTTALRELAKERSWPLLNVNLVLSERLLELTSKQRSLKVPEILDQVAKDHGEGVLILDNTEVLFSPELKQDPLRLLQGLARNRTVIAAWAGETDGETLTYADPVHPEFHRYQQPDAVIVRTLGDKIAMTQTGDKESA
jgi:flagellar biosynthesis GTPase FlhF